VRPAVSVSGPVCAPDLHQRGDQALPCGLRQRAAVVGSRARRVQRVEPILRRPAAGSISQPAFVGQRLAAG
jgi:hypothetical protein